MMKPMLEICCGSFSDVKTAYENGADRVELNSALYMGGLTPTLANLIYAKENCNIPVVAMVRPRGGGFCYSDEEYETMLMDAKILLEHGADGIAFGFLTEEKMLDKKRTKEMIELIHECGREAVFHRAFDCIDNQDSAAEMKNGEFFLLLCLAQIVSSQAVAQQMYGMAENSLSIFKINMESILRFWLEAA